MSYKSLIFAVFMPRKEKIANTFVSAMLNSNGASNGIRTRIFALATRHNSPYTIPASINIIQQSLKNCK